MFVGAGEPEGGVRGMAWSMLVYVGVEVLLWGNHIGKESEEV